MLWIDAIQARGDLKNRFPAGVARVSRAMATGTSSEGGTMEQSLPPGAFRGASNDGANGREDPARSAALRAMPSRLDIALPSESGVGGEKLVNAHTHDKSCSATVDSSIDMRESDRLGPLEIAAFAHTVLSEGPDAGLRRIEALIGGGLRLDAVYLDLLAPAARHLGELWEDDRARRHASDTPRT